MSAHNHHLSSILVSFSTFLDTQVVPTATAEEALVLIVEFLRQKPSLESWSAQEVSAFAKSGGGQNKPHYSEGAIGLVENFIRRFPPYQANTFLHEFVLALKADGCSDATIKNYRSDINQFIHWAQEYELARLVAKPKVVGFLQYEKQKGLKDASAKRKLVSISQFILWAQKQGIISNSVQPWLTELNQNCDQILGNISSKTKTPSKPPQDSKKTWSLPTPTPLSPKNLEKLHPKSSAQSRQEYRLRLQKSLSGLTQKISQEAQRHFLPYLNLAMIALFFLGAGYFGWRQFGQDAPAPLAYPTALTRPNRTLSFQGRLTDTVQNPIFTSTNLQFQLYDTGPGTGGTLLWDSGTCAITPDQDGIFSTGLGDDCGSEIAASVFTENSNVWLEVTVAGETLAPRQQIKTVAYALNSETLQGYPASASAVENTVLVMDNSGEVVLGNTNPVLRATGSSFAIEAETLTLRTASGSNGNITLDPDGSGITQALSNLVATGYFAAPGATLSATYAGGTALVAKGGPSGTANIQEWQNSAGTGLSVVDESGNLGIGTTNPSQALDVVGSANLSSGNAYKINGTNVLTSSTLGSGVTASSLTSVGTLTSGTWNASTIGPTYGGTGLTSYSTGDLLYASATNTLAKRTIGSTNQVLTVVGGVPTWADPGAAGSVAWSGLTNPTANLSLAMGTYTTAFNWATGTSTNNLFSLTSDASADGTGALLNIQTGASATLLPLRVRAGSTEALAVKSDGNVGIGTTAPGAKLDVAGNVLIAGGGTIDARAAGTITIGGTTQTGLTLGRSGANSTLTGAITTLTGATAVKVSNLTTNGVVYTSGGDGTLNSEALLAISRGGTNSSATPTAGAVAYGSGSAYAFNTAGTSGQALLSGGTGAPTFGTLGLTYGGTNADLSAAATGGLIYKGASALTATGALTGVLKGNGSSAPTALTSTTDYVAYWSDANTIAGEQYLSTSRGGLGANSTAAGAGELLYSTGTTAYGHLAAGTSGQILKSGGAGAPTWNTGAALTKTDDTNITLTLGGSASTALVNAASLTLGWTGELSLARGGTAKNITASAGSVVYSDADSFELTGVGTSGYVLTSSGTGAPTWTNPAALGVKWNSIANPDDNQTLTMGAYTTTWTWNSLTTGTGLTASTSSLSSGTLVSLTSTSTAAASNTQKVLGITTSGANATSTQTTYGLYATNTHTGTASTNIAGYFSASGGTNNYAGIFENGNVGIGNAAPTATLDVTGTGKFSGLLTTTGISNSTTAITNSAAYTQSGTSANTFTGASSFTATGNALSVTNNAVLGSADIGGGYGSTGVTISSAGNIQANGTLTVDGISTLTGAVTMTNGFDSNAASTITSLTLDGNTGTALNISGTSFSTDINLRNGDTINNTAAGTLALSSSTLTASSLSTLTTAASVSWGAATSLTFTADNATIYGSDAANGNLTLHGTSSATKTTSYVLLQPSGGSVGIANSTPTATLDITGSLKASSTITFSGLSSGIVKANGSGVLSGGNTVTLTSEVSGVLPIANGGTNTTATPTAGGIAYGTGSAYAFNSAGTSGYFLTSGGTGAPTWTDPSSIAAGSVAWSALTAPTGNLSLAMGAYTTAFSWSNNATTQDLFGFAYTNTGGTAGTDQVVTIKNAVSTATTGDLTTEALLLLDQADTTTSGNTAVTNALLITNSGGSTLTNGLQIGSGSQAIGTGINLASTGITTDINLQNGETIDNDTDGVITFGGADIQVNGNDIRDSGGTNRITLGATTTLTNTTTTLSGTSTLTASSLSTLTTAASVSWGAATSLTFTADNATIYGSDAANGNLTLEGTSSGTKTTSYVLLQPSGGNVGIGTTNPDANLHVFGDGSSATFALGEEGGGVARQTKLIKDGSGANYNLDFYWSNHATTNTGNLTFYSSQASPRVTFQGSSGNVGIGTTAPGQELDVNGDILIAGGGTIDTRASGTLTVGGTTQTGLILGRSGQSTRIANLTTNGVIYTSSGNGTLNSEATLALTRGGTNASLTAVNGGIVYSSASAMAISAAGSSGECLKSGGAGAPTWGACSTGSVTGSGTTNYLSKWTSGSVLGNSILYDNGSGVGIGTTTISRELNIYSTNGAQVYLNSTTGSWSGLEFQSTSYDSYMGQLDSDGRFFIDTDSNGEDFTILQGGNVGIGTTTPGAQLAVADTISMNGIRLDQSFDYDDGIYFAPQAYFEAESPNTPDGWLWSIDGFEKENNTDSPFSQVAKSSSYDQLYSDYIPVNPGETLYGEIWGMRDSGATGTAGTVYYGIERYDKDKLPIATNQGTVYAFASNQTIPTNGVWTKYSGTSTLPTSHTPYSGSDGGPVRYVRVRVLMNYNAGTIPTHWGGILLRRVTPFRDLGGVAFNGNVGVGTVSPSGKLDVAGDIRITANGSFASNVAQLYRSATDGLVITGYAGSSNDLLIGESAGGNLLRNPAGTSNLIVAESGYLGIGATELPIRETNFGYGASYKVLQLGNNDTASRSLALNIDPSGVSGGNFTGRGQILIPKDRSILAPNNAGTDWGGVLRYTSDKLYLGGGLSSGEVSGTGITVLASDGNVGIATTSPGAKLHVNDSTDVGLSSGGALIVGVTASSSVRVDDNEIAAFTSGNQTGAILYLQNDAGTVNLGASALTVANGGNTTVGSNLIVSGLTASLPVKTNGSKQLVSGAINLASAEVTGTLPIANGGTNSTATPTAGGVAYGTGSAYAFTSAGTSGHCLKSGGASAPTWGLCSTGSTTGSGTTNYLAKWTAGTVLGDSVIYDNGTNVGIGTTTPSGKLEVNAGTQTNGYNFYSYVNPTNGTSAGTLRGNYNVVAGVSSATDAYYRIGTGNFVTDNVSSGITNSGYAMGLDSAGYLSGVGTLSGVYGARLDAGTYTGGSGTVTAAYGAMVRILNQGSGTITNAYGVNIQSNAYSGTITNMRGIQINDLAGTNVHAIYQVSADDVNYFAGNVGIGDSTPTNGNLEIQAGSATPAYFQSSADSQLTLKGTDTWAGLTFSDASATDYLWYNGSTSTFAIGGGGASASSKKLHIDGATSIGANYDSNAAPTNGLIVEGNVGIGTTSVGARLDLEASSGDIFHINGTGTNNALMRFQDDGTETAAIYTLNGATDLRVRAQGGLYLDGGGGTNGDIFVKSDGNVGIGTTAPATALDVNGITTFRNYANIGAAGAQGYLTWSAGATNTVNLTGASGKSVSLGSNDVHDRLYLNTSGNVGIGTTSPSANLHVFGNGTIAEFIVGEDASSARQFRITKDGTTNYHANIYWSNNATVEAGNLYFHSSQDSGALVTFLSDGNVGIGTTPTGKLDVAGDIRITANGSFASNVAQLYRSATDGLVITGYAGSSNDLLIGESAGGNLLRNPAGTSNLIVAESGYLGIGATELPIRETNFGYGASYKVLQLGNNDTASRSLALNIDPSGVSGGNFTGRGQILIPKDRSILAPNSAGTDWGGVLRYTSDKLYLGGGLSSGEVSGTGITVLASGGNVGINHTNPGYKLEVGGTGYFSNTLTLGANLDMNAQIITNSIGLRASSGETINVRDYATDQAKFTFKTNTGNLGIGTTNPTVRLHVGSTSETNATERITLQTDSGSTAAAGFTLGRGGTNYAQLAVSGNGNTYFDYQGALYFRPGFESASTRVTFKNDGNVGIGTTNPSYQLQLSSDSAAKPTSNTWTIASDRRLKKNITSFEDGLNVILGINPVTYQLNGQAGLPDNTNGIGIIAQEIKEVAPYTVSTFEGDLFGKKTQLYSFDSNALTFVLINATKEQQVQINRLAKVGELSFSSTGEVIIAGQENNYQVTPTTSGSPIAKIAILAEAAIGRLRAGFVVTKDLVVTNTATIADLSVNTLAVGGQTIQTYIDQRIQTALQSFSSQPATNSALISPVVTTENITSQTATVSGTTTTNNLVANGSTRLGSLLATEATVAGTLSAESITTETLTAASARVTALEAGLAQLEEVRAQVAELTSLTSTNIHTEDATVSGTLYANNIHNLDKQVATALKQPTLLQLLLDQQPSNPAPATSAIATVETAGYTATNSASLRLALADLQLDSSDVVLETNALYVQQYLEVNGTAYVGGSLGVATALTVGDGLTLSSGAIAYQPTLDDPSTTLFQIQPSGRGTLSLLAGLLTLNESGQVTISGNLAVAGDIRTEGTLLTNLLKPTDYGSPLQVQVAGIATESGTVTESRFEVINQLQSPVATISARGKADFAAGLGVAADDLRTLQQASASATLSSDKTAGKATIPALKNEVTIFASALSDSSLIYVTPLGSTQNQSLYVKSQQKDNPATPENEASFTVGFDLPSAQSVEFNWWIVN